MKRIYLNEFNIPTAGKTYLPLATGMLRAYAETFRAIKQKYKFMPFIFERDTPENILKKYKDPSIAAFSVSCWNYNLCLEVATLVKEKFPECKIIFGGASVPDKKFYPIDYIIKGEGEYKFASYLLGIEPFKQPDINDYPSPYNAGLYDYLMKDNHNYQAIIETNRGCYNHCSYCYWGHGGLDKKMKFFPRNFILNSMTWIADNKIEYVFIANSNFGCFKQDIDVSKMLFNVKQAYGYPKKVRACFGHTNYPVLIETTEILSAADLNKAITVSPQSANINTLKAINRHAFTTKSFEIKQKCFSRKNHTTYTEFILGLPEETLRSFKDGIKRAIYLNNNKLFIYHCQILPNTQMNTAEYRKKYGIVTVKIPISEIHCEPRKKGIPEEYEEIVIQTKTMRLEHWIMASVWSWRMQLVYGLGYEGKISKRIDDFFLKHAHNIVMGKRRGIVYKEFGNIYYEPEEIAFLLLKKNKVKDVKEFARKRILYGRKSTKRREK